VLNGTWPIFISMFREQAFSVMNINRSKLSSQLHKVTGEATLERNNQTGPTYRQACVIISTSSEFDTPVLGPSVGSSSLHARRSGQQMVGLEL